MQSSPIGPSGTVQPHRRVYELDLLRFIAALSVVLFHYTFRGWSYSDQLSNVAFPILGNWFQLGELGVDLFFIISGFVILMSVQGRSSADFLVSRFVRLFPTYWLCILISALAIVCFGGSKFSVSVTQVVFNFTMIQEIIGVPDVEGVYWTLLVELKFYFLVFAVLVSGLRRFFVPLLYLWLGITIYQHYFGTIPLVRFFLIPTYAGYFISGCAFFLCLQGGWKMAPIGLIVGGYFWAMLNMDARLDSIGVLSGQIIISICFLFFIGIVSGWFKSWTSPIFLKLGALTYPLYLVHESIGYMIMNSLSSVNSYLVLCFTTLLLMIIAWTISEFFEKPIARPIKNKLTKIAHSWLPKTLLSAD